jgi:predicted RNA binding protein YcfA (HicA-like mRNA interferase family)
VGRLPELPARRVLSALRRAGFSEVRRRGSHRFLAHPDGRTMVFALHQGERVGPKLLAKFEGTHPREPRVRYPRCVAGARACPPEDVGGTPGYEEFLAAVADPEHEGEDMLRWVGGSFDLEAFAPQRVRFDDPRMRWRLAFARR